MTSCITLPTVKSKPQKAYSKILPKYSSDLKMAVLALVLSPGTGVCVCVCMCVYMCVCVCACAHLFSDWLTVLPESPCLMLQETADETRQQI